MAEIIPLKSRQDATPLEDGTDVRMPPADVNVTEELRRVRAERAAREAIEYAKGKELSQDEIAIARIRDITVYLDTVQNYELEPAA